MTAAGAVQASVLVDVASLTAAVAALVVAVVALYLTSLRRADVEVDLVPTSNALSGAAPAQLLDVMVFVSNTGIPRRCTTRHPHRRLPGETTRPLDRPCALWSEGSWRRRAASGTRSGGRCHGDADRPADFG